MNQCMRCQDDAHDIGHIYRVLNNAINLMKHYGANKDIVMASCLSHFEIYPNTSAPDHIKVRKIAMENCLICQRIEMIKREENNFFVREMDTGYVVIGDHQYFRGYTLFLLKDHVTELHLLEEDTRKKHLYEMSIVGEAAYRAFNAQKMNYELLGNGDAHMHWHIFPRVDGDGDVKGPVWWTDKNKMYSDEFRPDLEALEIMKMKLSFELDRILGV